MSSIVTGIDTNLLVYALNADAPENGAARAWLASRQGDPDTVLSELVLVELYVLLRNPAVFTRTLDAAAACAIVRTFREHPTWRLLDHDPTAMEEVWKCAGTPGFARTRIFDVRLAIGLRRQGVTHFATRNIKHFQGLGFTEVFDPLAA